MADLSYEDGIKALERIRAQYSVQAVIEEVFTSESSQNAFTKVLCDLAALPEASISVGGRRVRELLGCKITDISPWVATNAVSIRRYGEHDLVKLWPLIEILQAYPTSRMVAPDLDLFTWNIKKEAIVNILNTHGFETTIHVAAGGVWVIDVKGEKGAATFVDGSLSWQTGKSWPMFNCLAKFEQSPSPFFDLNIGYGRLYLYPLEVPFIDRSNPLDAKRVAALGRALLWLATVATPDKHNLRIPFNSSQQLFFDTVAALFQLLERIQTKPELLQDYRSGLRDFAVALRIIVLQEWGDLPADTSISQEYYHFLGQIRIHWLHGFFQSFPES